jgi:hypothetical protein
VGAAGFAATFAFALVFAAEFVFAGGAQLATASAAIERNKVLNIIFIKKVSSKIELNFYCT